jgi:hypothetical protein
MEQAEGWSKQKCGTSIGTEQKHVAEAWCRSMEQRRRAGRSMEQAEAWSKQKRGASISTEQAEAWSKQ